MTFARKFGLRTAVALFSFSIFGLAIAYSLNSAFGTPDNLKSALQKGKVYEVVADGLAKNVSAEPLAEQHIRIDQKTVQNAAEAAITSELVQENSEKIIDGTYSWLDGTTQTPDFTLDTKKIQQQMSTNLANAAVTRVQKLPPCTPEQVQTMRPNTLDPFSLPCQPPGFSAATIRKQLARDLASQGGLLQSDPIESGDITTPDGQNVFTQANRIPGMFQLGQKLPWIFGFLAIISAAIVMYFAEPRLRGVKSLSISLIITGLLLLLSIVVISFIFRQVGANITGPNETGNAALIVMQTLTEQVNSPLRIFAVVYVLLGICCFILPRLISPRIKPSRIDTSPPNPARLTPTEPTSSSKPPTITS